MHGEVQMSGTWYSIMDVLWWWSYGVVVQLEGARRRMPDRISRVVQDYGVA